MISTLALKKSDYQAEMGSYLGWGRTEWADDEGKLAKIQMDTASALRKFYWPGHPWSFLKQTATLTLLEGATTVAIPEWYAGLDGGTEIIVLDSSENRIVKLMPVHWNTVQGKFGTGTNTGSPLFIAQRPIKNVPAGGTQRTEFYVWPEANADYTLVFPAFFTPDYLLDVKMPYALGGVEHHETILEMCLAAVELRRDNVRGIHSQEAEIQLKKSIAMDARKQPIKLGYNQDRSDGPDWDKWNRFNGHGWGDNAGGVTIDGVRYT